MLTAEGIDVGMALSWSVYHLEDKVLQRQKPVGYLTVHIPVFGQPSQGGVAGYESEALAL